ncbi:MAG: transporter substrate-binding domain-containing protein [Pseudomonadota bacterium]
MRRRLLMGFALCAFTPAPLLAREGKSVNVSTLVGTDPATSVAEQVLAEAYHRLGYELVVHRVPGERSLLLANDGQMDGELYRKLGMDREYPHLMIIPVPLLIYEIVIFTRGTSFVVNGWDSLRPFTVGFVRGIKIVQENTRGMKTEAVATIELAFQKMLMGRTDIVVGSRTSGLAAIAALKLDELKMLSPPLASFPVYHYLHNRHAALVPRLTRVLQQMQADRVIEKIQGAVLSTLPAAGR